MDVESQMKRWMTQVNASLAQLVADNELIKTTQTTIISMLQMAQLSNLSVPSVPLVGSPHVIMNAAVNMPKKRATTDKVVYKPLFIHISI